MRRSSFDLLHDVRDALLRVYADKHMHMVCVAFHGEDVDAMRQALCRRELLKTVFHAGNIEYLPAITGTEHKMVVDQRYSCFGVFIFILHVYIITHRIYKIKLRQGFHPTVKTVGFPALKKFYHPTVGTLIILYNRLIICCFVYYRF